MSSTLFLVSLDNTESHVIAQLVDSVNKLRGEDDVSLLAMHACSERTKLYCVIRP